MGKERVFGRLACIYRWPGSGSGRRWHSPQLLCDICTNIRGTICITTGRGLYWRRSYHSSKVWLMIYGPSLLRNMSNRLAYITTVQLTMCRLLLLGV
jgi:hypothetical protein